MFFYTCFLIKDTLDTLRGEHLRGTNEGSSQYSPTLVVALCRTPRLHAWVDLQGFGKGRYEQTFGIRMNHVRSARYCAAALAYFIRADEITNLVNPEAYRQ